MPELIELEEWAMKVITTTHNVGLEIRNSRKLIRNSLIICA